jgi:hypothetical protein
MPFDISLFTRINISGKIFPLANNGWIYNGKPYFSWKNYSHYNIGNPLVDFAGPHSTAYLERSVIVWGVCLAILHV